jgi:hypothetical protein
MYEIYQTLSRAVPRRREERDDEMDEFAFLSGSTIRGMVAELEKTLFLVDGFVCGGGYWECFRC